MVSHEIHCAINATIVAVVLNLVLPMLVKNIATPEEVNPTPLNPGITESVGIPE